MALCIIDFGTKEHEQMLVLRQQILRAPLGLQLGAADIEADKNHILVGAFEDDVMLGCCMLVHEGAAVLLRQMAVRNDVQGKGIGRALMQFAENIAYDRGYREISMYARKTAVPFYEKLGYKCEGLDFMHLTIAHILMKKKL